MSIKNNIFSLGVGVAAASAVLFGFLGVALGIHTGISVFGGALSVFAVGMIADLLITDTDLNLKTFPALVGLTAMFAAAVMVPSRLHHIGEDVSSVVPVVDTLQMAQEHESSVDPLSISFDDAGYTGTELIKMSNNDVEDITATHSSYGLTI